MINGSMSFDLTKDEIQLLLDGLSQLRGFLDDEQEVTLFDQLVTKLETGADILKKATEGY